jgi:ectoine hydroxylase-related dioxygenase (phytanoyl-CoA dioxygenase family)
MNYSLYSERILNDGYTIIDNVFDESEIATMAGVIDQADHSNPTFRKTADLFAIRQFLKELPAIKQDIFTPKFNHIITGLFGDGYFAVKSIYFDKPEKSNWFVAYHQDLTISVNQKFDIPGFGPWTVKHQQFSVQPPINILQNNFTVRIHLDDTDETNGALKVIPSSYNKGICRPETINWEFEKEVIVNVNRGGIMIMRPLLLHASNRSTGNKRRRVVHIEFSKARLPEPLKWSEKTEI